MKLPYYGSKDEKNLQITLQILPERPIKKFVDSCFGSGNVTRTLSCEMLNVQRIGIELDRGMFALHSQIKADVYSLIKSIKAIENTEQQYLYYKNMLEKYVEGTEEYEQLEIAAAELMVLTFSINSMRGKWRNKEFYKKHTQEEKWEQGKKVVEGFETKFYEKIPVALLELNEHWKEVELINGSFMEFTEYWEEVGTLCYLDLPYELKKRGIKNQDKKREAGYMKDMTQADHEQFIRAVCEKADAGNLRADMMICTNYEVDESTGRLIIEPDDLYIKLLKHGFRMVVTERKESSEIIVNNNKQDKKKRKVKAEVVFINYSDIRGSWDNIERYDSK